MNKTAFNTPTPARQAGLLRYAAICALAPYLLAATALLLFGGGA